MWHYYLYDELRLCCILVSSFDALLPARALCLSTRTFSFPLSPLAHIRPCGFRCTQKRRYVSLRLSTPLLFVQKTRSQVPYRRYQEGWSGKQRG